MTPSQRLVFLLRVYMALVDMRKRIDQLLNEVRPMDAEIQQAIDDAKAKVATEAGELATKVQELKNAVNAGVGKAEIISQINDIGNAVSALSDAFNTSAPPADPNG